MTLGRHRRYRQSAVIFLLLFAAGILAWRYRGAEPGAVAPSLPERVCAGLIELAGQERAAWSARRVAGAVRSVFGKTALTRENEELAAQTQLFRERIRALEREVASPARLPGLQTGRDQLVRLLRNAVRATVIARGPDKWSETVILDVGRTDNVHAGDVAVNGPDLVGTVVRANRRTSTVQLLTDRGSRVHLRCARSGQYVGVARGTAGGPLRVDRVPLSADLREGDLVQTAGLGSAVPGGIVVGVVVSYHRIPPTVRTAVNASATIEPLADMNDMAGVRVLRTSTERGRPNGS